MTVQKNTIPSDDAIEILAKQKEEEETYHTTPVSLIIFLIILIAILIVSMLLAFLFRDEVIDSIRSLNGKRVGYINIQNLNDRPISYKSPSYQDSTGEVLSVTDDKNIDCSFFWKSSRLKSYSNPRLAFSFSYPENTLPILTHKDTELESVDFLDQSSSEKTNMFTISFLNIEEHKSDLETVMLSKCSSKSSSDIHTISTMNFNLQHMNCSADNFGSKLYGLYLDRNTVFIIEDFSLSEEQMDSVLCSLKLED